MTYAHLALGLGFTGLAAIFFVQAQRARDGQAERRARLAGTLFGVGAVAFLIAAMLGFVTGAGT